jgi:O-acetylhomoserine (thiol)-lyase
MRPALSLARRFDAKADQFLRDIVIGDTRMLVTHPVSNTHRQLEPEQLVAAGVTPDLVWISVGLETIDDILWDVDQALEVAVSAA